MSRARDLAGRSLAIDANGLITMPLQPAFRATRTTDIALSPSAVTTTALEDTTGFDRGGNYDNVTYTFTAPVTGLYHLHAHMRIDALDATSDYYAVNLVTSNRGYTMLIDPGQFGGDPNYWFFSVSILADMDAGDTALVNTQQKVGAVQSSINATASVGPEFSGYLVAYSGETTLS
jgi:hypothetical protein